MAVPRNSQIKPPTTFLEEQCVRAYFSGWSPKTISEKTGAPLRFVREVIQKARLSEIVDAELTQLRNEAYKNKLPLIKEITELSLSTIKDFLVDLSTDEKKKARLTIDDAVQLKDLVKGLDEMINLELGKPTTIVGVNHSQSIDYATLRATFEAASKLDPVFTYPKLPDVDTTAVNASGGASQDSNGAPHKN